MSNAVRDSPPSALEHARVLDALACVNAWLASHGARFSPLGERDTDRASFRTQAFGEICLYLHLAEAFGVAAHIPETLYAQIGAIVRSDAFGALLLSTPARTATLLICLLPGDWRDAFPGVPQFVKTVCKPLNGELQPFQLLSHVYIFDALGLYDAQIAAAEARAIAVSALGEAPNHFTPAYKGPYTFTHSAFYATRFGLRRLDMPEGQARALTDYADIELCRAFSSHNMDVALEIVLANICLFGRATERDILVIESAMSLVEEKGHLLSPKVAAATFGDDAQEAEWEASYHTMAVLGILLMKIASNRQAIVFEGARAQDTAYMEDLALAMDSVGTLYGAAEAGNLALAVYIHSKLKELGAELMPSAAIMAPAIDYIEGIAALIRARRGRAGAAQLSDHPLGLSAEEFDKIMDLFERGRAGL